MRTHFNAHPRILRHEYCDCPRAFAACLTHARWDLLSYAMVYADAQIQQELADTKQKLADKERELQAAQSELATMSRTLQAKQSELTSAHGELQTNQLELTSLQATRDELQRVLHDNLAAQELTEAEHKSQIDALRFELDGVKAQLAAALGAAGPQVNPAMMQPCVEFLTLFLDESAAKRRASKELVGIVTDSDFKAVMDKLTREFCPPLPRPVGAADRRGKKVSA
jgi:hypothetical protein